jgi:Cof subfamily protein (haloacid dehalogenase superfamily)
VAARAYDALVLDIDGTLLDNAERIHPHTRVALDRARAAGVTVMLATGRSHGGAREITRELALDTPAIVFNGAAVYCPIEDRLIEQTVLPQSVVVALLAHARDTGVLAVVAHAEGQLARAARTPEEARVLADFRQLRVTDEAELHRPEAIRVTLLSERHVDSLALHAAVQRVVGRPAYLTHFALAALPRFADSPMQVVDVQPQCAGKAHAFVVLSARFGIAAARVVAVGDASNDVPMLRGAGLAVAMGNATQDAKRDAHRVIGDNNGNALATLIEELFLDGS